MKILDIFPRLRHLEVTEHEELEWNNNVVNTIATSLLQTLKIRNVGTNIDYLNPIVVHTDNDTLETLHLNFYLEDVLDSIIIPSIKSFRKLRSLSLGNFTISSSVLENIRIHQV